MSDLDMRPFSADELEDVELFLRRAFGAADVPETLAQERPLFEPDRSLAAYFRGQMVGTTWIQSLRMVVPGGVRAVAGVTGVGVSPVYRRRGVLTALMVRQLADVHARGTEAVAALWASEPAVYGRFGYGLAAPLASVRGERAHLRFVGPDQRDMRLRLTTEPDLAQLGAVTEAASRPGTIMRDKPRWAVRLADPSAARGGAGELVTVLADSVDGTTEGYVLYRPHAQRGETGPAGVVRIIELVAATTRARAALWRHVASVDLMASFESYGLPVDDPLFHMVVDPRRLSFKVADGLFVRVVDLPRALAERSYRTRAAATVEVVDDMCPWNAGRWRIELSPDGASCERTDARVDLTLSAVELGAAYLGGPTLRTLALAGRVDEYTSNALGPLSDALAGEVAPQCYEVF